MKKLVNRVKVKLEGMADQIAGVLKGVTYKADMAAKAVTKIVKGASKGQHRLRTIGAGAGVMAFLVSALLSGCYYRGRPPEYGRRGYGHHYDRRY